MFTLLQLLRDLRGQDFLFAYWLKEADVTLQNSLRGGVLFQPKPDYGQKNLDLQKSEMARTLPRLHSGS